MSPIQAYKDGPDSYSHRTYSPYCTSHTDQNSFKGIASLQFPLVNAVKSVSFSH
jgi:hypothetical protein